MAIIRTATGGTIFTHVFKSTLNVGSLAATPLVDPLTLGSLPTGKYLVGILIRINANAGASTITAVTVDGKNLIAINQVAPSLSGAVAIGTEYHIAVLADLTVATPTIATTTASSPQYDITVTMTFLAEI